MRPIHIDLILLWVGLMGIWPLADPGHSGHSLLSVLDIALHLGAGFALACRWQVVRRTPTRQRVND